MRNDEFDKLGAGEVSARLASNVYLGAEASLARAWLARESARSSAEQLLLARRASEDAHKANKIAVIALAVAVISTIVSIVAVAIGLMLKH